MSKKGQFDQLIGQKIVAFGSPPTDNRFKNYYIGTDKFDYNLILDDDSDGGNDSWAFLQSADLISIANQEIIDIEEVSDSYGATIKIFTKDNFGTITIVHEQNGYYGFSYDLIPSEKSDNY